MARLSPEKKQEIKNKIINVASKMFFEDGYDNTSTSKIAQEVGIAEGTIFNYFKSKAELFLVIASEKYKIENLDEINIDSGSCIEDLIFELFEKGFQPFGKIPKLVLKELFGALLEFAKKKPILAKKLIDLDYKFLDNLNKLLVKLNEKKLIQCDHIDILSENIFSSLGFEIILYVYEASYEVDKMYNSIREKIKILIAPYKK